MGRTTFTEVSSPINAFAFVAAGEEYVNQLLFRYYHAGTATATTTAASPKSSRHRHSGLSTKVSL